MRRLRIAIGSVLLGIGILGCIVPILPGVPFLIAGAALMGRNHPRIQYWKERIQRWVRFRRGHNE